MRSPDSSYLSGPPSGNEISAVPSAKLNESYKSSWLLSLACTSDSSSRLETRRLLEGEGMSIRTAIRIVSSDIVASVSSAFLALEPG